VVVALVALATAAVACGAFDKDDPAPGANTPGSGSGDGSAEGGGIINGNPDPRDAATDGRGDGGTAKTPARLFVVNALTDMGPFSPNNRPTGGSFRLCYALTGLGVATRQAMPSIKRPGEPIAGIRVGTAYQVLAPLSLAQFEVVPYLVSAEILDSGEIYNTNDAGDDGPKIDCKQLIEDGFVLPSGAGDGGKIKLVENVDYWKLDPIPPGTLKDDKTYALVATGCAGDSTNNAVNCGAGFTTTGPGKGNMALAAVELDTTPVSANAMGFQFVHAAATLKGTSRIVIPTILDNGVPTELSTGAVDYPPVVTPKKVLQNLTIDSANPEFTPSPNGGEPIAKLPLALGTAFSRDSSYASPTLANGNSYCIVALGDPSPAFPGSGGFTSPNLHLLHHIIIKTNP